MTSLLRPRITPRRGRWLAAAAVASALALLGTIVPHAEAGEAPTKRYRDRNFKFSILNFPSWAPIPIESSSSSGFSDTLDDCLVAKFSESKDRGREAGELRVYRMGVDGTPMGARSAGTPTTGDDQPATPTTPSGDPAMGGDDGPGMDPGMGDEPGMGDSDPGMGDGQKPAKPQPPRITFRRETAKTMVALFDELLERLRSRQHITGLKAKDVMSRDKVPGRLWMLETRDDEDQPAGSKPIPKEWVRSLFQVFAIWEKDGVQTGLWIACPGSERKKMEASFKQIVSSFTWFDTKAEDVESLPILDGLKISAGKRREIERTLVSGWDVVVSKKKNYVVVYNTKGRRNDQLAKTLAERIEAIREQVYEVQFPPAKPIEAVSIARVCGDRREYHQYGGPGGSAGYWNDDAEELVFYDASPAKEIDDDTLAVLYHEAFHQYIYYSVGSVAPHSWFNEGHGDYYAGAKYKGGKFEIKPFNWRTGVLKAALVAGPSPFEWETKNGEKARKWDRAKGGYSPIEQLVTFSQGEYYSYPNVSYAQGWGLIYFLREIVPKNPKWNAKWGKILETYFNTLKAEVNRETPLTPKVVTPDGGSKPTDPGMGEPGMGEPGMGEPGSGEPAMGEPKPADPAGMDGMPPAPPGGDPGMDEPGMGDPGMGEPGMGDDKPDGGGDDPTGGFEIPKIFRRGLGSDLALEKALKAAFKDFKPEDWAEFETAWRTSMSKVNG